MSQLNAAVRQSVVIDRQFGGTCAILVGILWVITVITFFLGKGGLELLDLSWVLTGVLGLAVVPALTETVDGQLSAGLRWAQALGYLGFGVQALQYASVLQHPSLEVAIDPGEFLVFGGIAVWLVAANWVMWGMPGRGHWRAGLGLLLGLLYLVNILFSDVNLPASLTPIMGGIMVVVAPVWFIWSGVAVRRGA